MATTVENLLHFKFELAVQLVENELEIFNKNVN